MTGRDLGKQAAAPYQIKGTMMGSAYSTGMTKREAFAMAAMRGILSSHHNQDIAEVTSRAIKHADSILNLLATETYNG